MTPPWSPERVVSEKLAVYLIEEQFPQLVPVKLVEFGKGFDNTAFRVNNDWIFRFPRRAIAVELLKTEGALLPSLMRAKLPLAIPHLAYYGRPSASYPWSFIGYRLLKGETPGKLTMDQRMQSIKPLALFLRQLHRYPIDQAKQMGIPYDQFGRVHISSRKPQLEQNVQQLIADRLWQDHNGLLENYLASLQHVEPDDREVLAHGDLHIRNVLVNEKGVLCSVIDWGDAHIGHPAIDLAIIYYFLPPEGRERFMKIYGPIDEQTEKLARFRAIHSASWLLCYGKDHEDYKLIEAAKEILHLALMP